MQKIRRQGNRGQALDMVLSLDENLSGLNGLNHADLRYMVEQEQADVLWTIHHQELSLEKQEQVDALWSMHDYEPDDGCTDEDSNIIPGEISEGLNELDKITRGTYGKSRQQSDSKGYDAKPRSSRRRASLEQEKIERKDLEAIANYDTKRERTEVDGHAMPTLRPLRRTTYYPDNNGERDYSESRYHSYSKHERKKIRKIESAKR